MDNYTIFIGIKDKNMIDRHISKIKDNIYTPIYHVKIESSEILYDEKLRPDYVVILAWAYSENIINKHSKYLENGGKFIIPLPENRIISY